MKLLDIFRPIFLKSLLFGLILSFFSLQPFAQDKPSPTKLKVLFVGNSLTYYNNLPEIVAILARSAKQQKKFSYKMIAYPNFSLEDHWNKGEVQKSLAKEKWDYVIMQQGPSASAEGRQVLVDYAKKYAPEIERAGAQAAFYMVWPAAARLQDFAGVNVTYQTAAKETKGLFFPAGAAWLEAWDRDPKLELYGTDRFHPSFAGSYLAALVIYQRIYHQSPIGLTRQFRFSFEDLVEVPEKQAKILQEAAAEANKKYGF